MTKECCGAKEGSMCLTSRRWRIRYFVKRMNPVIPFIQKVIRCTIISRQPIGGMELREMLLFATHVRESRNQASTTCWIVATLASTQVKVRRDCYGFCHGIA
jgi:hypothetical protein